MPDQDGSNVAARPRAVADLPLAELSARRGELARRWAIALIMQRAPDQIGAVPLEEVVARGPELLEAALAAVGSDAALARLAGACGEPTPAVALPAICGAADAAAVAEAAEGMRAVLGAALAEELVLAPPAELAAAADRLAHVCAVMLATALRAPGAAAVAVAPRARTAAEPPGEAGGAAPGPVPPTRLRESARAAIVDERAPAPAAAPTAAAGAGTNPEPAAPHGPRDAAPPSGAADAPREIAIRDERGEGPGAWIGAIGRQLERHRSDGRPFAVLLVELIELERVRSQESAREAERLDGELERTLSAELARARDAASALVRPPVTEPLAASAPAAATFTRERPGRYWMVSPASDRAAARRLAERISSALAEWRSSGGLRLSVVVGAASCPEDGTEAAALAAYADVDLYAARSAARAHAAAAGHGG